MNIRIFALCLAFASSLGQAQKSPEVDEYAGRATMLETMLRGKYLIGDNEESYQHLPEMRAVLSTRLAVTQQQVLSTGLAVTQQQVVAQLRASGAQVVETKGKYVLFRIPQMQPALRQGLGDSTNYAVVQGLGDSTNYAVVQGLEDSTNYAVVLNTRTKNFGVLTGVQVVVPRDMADAAVIASDFGMEIVREFSHLRTVYYRVSPGIDIADLTAELQADYRIENAYPEIIENLHEPL